jgi:hypothetical protein
VCRNPGLQPKTIDIDPDRIVLLVFGPFATTLNQVVIQIKIPLDVQEWSLTIRCMVTRWMTLLAILLSVPLADRFF